MTNTKDLIRNAIQAGKLPWTPRAKAVMKHAEKLARKDGFDLVGTEHIFIGIVSVKDCLGAKILKNLGLAESEYVRSYEPLRPASPGKHAGQTRFSEDVEKVIRCAHEQSSEWGHEYIGAEHLLAGILLAGAGKGFQILTDLGITLEKVREETGQLVVCRSTHNERKGK
jgi:ATP-dependent Clp protease ATP-binding subunit ClpC